MVTPRDGKSTHANPRHRRDRRTRPARRAAAGRTGDDLLVHGRSADKVERVAREVGAAGGYVADLASLADVRRLAADVEKPDALINNAGLIVPERRESADGYELGFAVNYLSHFVLTLELLLPRIVNVASVGQQARLRRPDARAGLRRLPFLRAVEARAGHVHVRAGGAAGARLAT